MNCDGQICLRNDYSKTKVPKNECSDAPVEVDVKFNFIQIIEVNDIKLTVTLHMIPFVSWIDERIDLLNISNTVPIDLTWLKYLWFPDIYVYHLKELQKYKMLGNDATSAGK